MGPSAHPWERAVATGFLPERAVGGHCPTALKEVSRHLRQERKRLRAAP